MTKKAYFRKIDVLRIFLCIVVFLYHLEILKGGYLAVSSFFVLSGFLLQKQKRNRSEAVLFKKTQEDLPSASGRHLRFGRHHLADRVDQLDRAQAGNDFGDLRLQQLLAASG